MVGCVSTATEEKWRAQAEECENRPGGMALLHSLKRPRFVACVNKEALERQERKEMACLAGGNIPKYYGVVRGYGRPFYSCKVPDQNVNVNIRGY